MFNKSVREQKKELKNYKKEIKNNTFDDDIGDICGFKYHTIGNVIYVSEPAWKLVIDDYDSGIGSIERSHKETKGYSIINDYRCEYDTKVEELDFTFAKPQDVIDVKLDDDIKRVKVNSTNLRYTSFESEHPVLISVVVDTDVIDTLLGLKSFIESNRDTIRDINLINSGKMLDSALEKLMEKSSVEEGKQRGR